MRVEVKNNILFIDGEFITDNITKECINELIINHSKTPDWKALSHAVRVVDEAQELLTDGFVTFPLKNAEYVKSVKKGEVDVSLVMEELEKEMSKVENLLLTTSLPAETDKVFVNKALFELVKKYNKPNPFQLFLDFLKSLVGK